MLVTMSDKELSRINVIQSVVEKRMRRRDAAQLLALTERQTQRLMNRFRESGAAGLGFVFDDGIVSMKHESYLVFCIRIRHPYQNR